MRAAVLAAREADKSGIRDLVAAHGSPSQIARHAADVLPRSELRALARVAWLPTLTYPLYVPLVSADVDHSCDGDGKVHYSSSAVEGPWSEEQWDVIAKIRAAYRAAACAEHPVYLTEMEHKAWCSAGECDTATMRYGLRATVTRYGLTVKIEYGLPE